MPVALFSAMAERPYSSPCKRPWVSVAVVAIVILDYWFGGLRWLGGEVPTDQMSQWSLESPLEPCCVSCKLVDSLLTLRPAVCLAFELHEHLHVQGSATYLLHVAAAAYFVCLMRRMGCPSVLLCCNRTTKQFLVALTSVGSVFLCCCRCLREGSLCLGVAKEAGLAGRQETGNEAKGDSHKILCVRQVEKYL